MKWYVAPPPSLSGNDKKDLQDLHNYVLTLHRELSLLANNNIDEDNLTDDLKRKIKLISENEEKLKRIL